MKPAFANDGNNGVRIKFAYEVERSWPRVIRRMCRLKSEIKYIQVARTSEKTCASELFRLSKVSEIRVTFHILCNATRF